MLSNKNLGHSDNRTSRAADPVLRPLKPVGGATGAVGPAFARTERGSTPAASSADGEGSSYAPALTHVLKTMNYPGFANVVVNGGKNVNTAPCQGPEGWEEQRRQAWLSTHADIRRAPCSSAQDNGRSGRSRLARPYSGEPARGLGEPFGRIGTCAAPLRDKVCRK